MIAHWETALMHFAQSELGEPFVWGETNCVALGLRAVDVMTAGDMISKYRPYMTSEKRARAFVARHTAGDLASLWVADGMISAGNNPNFAQVGDLILADQDGTISCQVCLGSTLLSASVKSGVVLVPLESALWPEDIYVVRVAPCL